MSRQEIRRVGRVRSRNPLLGHDMDPRDSLVDPREQPARVKPSVLASMRRHVLESAVEAEAAHTPLQQSARTWGGTPLGRISPSSEPSDDELPSDSLPATNGGQQGSRAAAAENESGAAAIRVFARVKPKEQQQADATSSHPASARRAAASHRRALTIEGDGGEVDADADGAHRSAHAHSIVLADGGGRFSFNQVFPGRTSNTAIFDAVGMPLVHSLLEGYNSTLLAYGQTGTGKTYTLGEATRVGTETEGLMPRMLRELFAAGPKPGSPLLAQPTLEVSLQYYQL